MECSCVGAFCIGSDELIHSTVPSRRPESTPPQTLDLKEPCIHFLSEKHTIYLMCVAVEMPVKDESGAGVSSERWVVHPDTLA